MFSYIFSSLISTDPETWQHLEVFCECNEVEGTSVVLHEHILRVGTLRTYRKNEDGGIEEWEDDDNNFSSTDVHEVWKAIGWLDCCRDEKQVKKILSLLLLSSQALHG